MRKFRVIGRAPASALFRPNEVLPLAASFDGEPITIRFQTRYLPMGYSTPAPGDLSFDAQGNSSDLHTAARTFTNLARDIAAVVALSANATIAPLTPEVIYEVIPGEARREYLQRFVRPDDVALTSRFIDVTVAGQVISALPRDVERNRLTRAISQYSEALKNWRTGDELLALSHLFMGVEAIKTACWRSKVIATGESREKLAAEWSYLEGGRLPLKVFLDQEARVRLVFKGDQKCHRLAKMTSDHFEHGFSNAGELYQAAGESLVPTAEYLREAILTISDLSPESRELMLGKKYKTPRGPLGMETYLRGFLVGEEECLAAEGTEYPFCRWKAGLKDVSFDPSKDRYSFIPDETFTASLGEGTELESLTLEKWDSSIFVQQSNSSDQDSEDS